MKTLFLFKFVFVPDMNLFFLSNSWYNRTLRVLQKAIYSYKFAKSIC